MLLRFSSHKLVFIIVRLTELAVVLAYVAYSYTHTIPLDFCSRLLIYVWTPNVYELCIFLCEINIHKLDGANEKKTDKEIKLHHNI